MVRGEKDKLQNIDTKRNSRIYFKFKDVEYSVNVTNENELRLSVIEGGLTIKPYAFNCLIFEQEK